MRFVGTMIILGALAGCGDDLQVGTDAQWHVQCPQGAPGCVSSNPPVQPAVFDGQDDVRVSCSVRDAAGDNKLIAVQIFVDANHSFELTRQIISSSGAIAGEGTVRVVDGDSNLTGVAHGGEPDDTRQCQLMPVEFHDRAEGPSMTVRILCRGIRNEANPGATQRDLVFPNDQTRPASITVFNCDGL